ncbi:MAG: hypothetical protein LBF74_01575 [Treponema sp.]|nr:hypothetical protein [Treponema sp.]
MDVAKVPHGSGEFATTIPDNKPDNKPVVAAEEIPKGQMAQPVENFEKTAAGFFNSRSNFHFIFRLGTAGAAWATAAGHILSFSYGVWYFLSKKTNLSINPFDYKPNKIMLFQILSIGVPAGLSFRIMSVSNIWGNRIAASYGDHVIAGNGVQMRITSFIFMIILGLNNGYQPFPGYNYGAKQFERLRKGLN